MTGAPRAERMTYRGADGDELSAFVYRPVEPARDGVRAPIVLDLHGGAWTWFSPEVDITWCRALAEAGYVVVAVAFRSARVKPWPAPFADQRAALAWVRTNAAVLGGDPDRVIVLGGSTGGHAALLAGIDGAADGRRPEAVVALWPITDVRGRYDLITSTRFDPVARHLARRLERHADAVDRRAERPGGAPVDPVAARLTALDDQRRRHRRRGNCVGAVLQTLNVVQGAAPPTRCALYRRLRHAHELTFPEGPDQMATASPLHALAAIRDGMGQAGFVAPPLPPALVVHAGRDTNTTEKMSRDAVQLWRELGGRARFELMRGRGHSFGNIAGRASDELIERILGFLRAEGLSP